MKDKQLYQVVYKSDNNIGSQGEYIGSHFTDNVATMATWFDRKGYDWVRIYQFPQMKQITKVDVKVS